VITDERIEAVLNAVERLDPDLSESTVKQARRWGRPFLEWCAAERLRPSTADSARLLDMYESAFPVAFGRSRSPVRSQLRRVIRAADAILPRPRGAGGKYAVRLRELPERGRIARAVGAVMDGARNDAHRRQLRTTLGRFLLWCDDRGVRPEDCVPADLFAYLRHLQQARLTSTGPEIDAAKRLLAALR
jgi:hypothetical protein